MHSEWELLWRLGLALVLSTANGLGSALFLLVGEYGFFDELEPVWLVAAVGMAAGAGPAVLAIASTLAYLLVTTTYPFILQRLPGEAAAMSPLRVTYVDGRGVLREVLSRVTGAGFAVSGLDFRRHDEDTVVVDVAVPGRAPVSALVTELGALDGVLLVNAADADPD